MERSHRFAHPSRILHCLVIGRKDVGGSGVRRRDRIPRARSCMIVVTSRGVRFRPLRSPADVYGGKLYVFGGSSTRLEGECYDPKSNSWSLTAPCLGLVQACL